MAERKRFHIPTSEEMDDGKKDGSNNFRPTQIFKSYKEQQSASDDIIHKKARVEPATLQGKALQKQEETTISNSENSEVSYVVTSTSSTGSTNLLTDNKTILSDSEKKILSAPGTSKSILGQTKQRNQTENHSVDVSKLAIPGKTNSLLVNQRQRGNPILKYVRNIPWEFGDIVPDYVMGQTTCALFLSLRYHQLNPNYIHERLKQLGRSYDLRILLVQIDIKEPHHLLKELAKICILADCTLILAFSTEEAGRYLETYKVYENKPPDAIMEKTDQNFMAKMTECLTNIKSVNKTDVSTLISTFGSLKGIVEASQEDLSFCPGFGPQKAKRVHDLFKEPFLRTAFHTTVVQSKYKKYRNPYRWVPELIPQEEIKNNPLKPLKCHKTGGRGPDGRIWNRRRAGGDPKRLRVVDTTRTDLDGEPRVERVLFIIEDQVRSAHLAAVAGGDRKRYILATENMLSGDLITTSCVLTDIPVKAKEGDSYPVGNLPLGTIVHNIERVPGEGGAIAKAAGSSAIITKQVGNHTILRMPSKVEIQVQNTCMASVGKVSNALHAETPWDNINEKRRAGIKQRSGRYIEKGSQRKRDRPRKVQDDYKKAMMDPPEWFRYSLTVKDLL